MRKKSHITIGKCIGRELIEDKYRNSFITGNVIPDINPSFLLMRHEIDYTLNKVKMDIRLASNELYAGHNFYIRLGIISHYISDYFTLPHNKIYKGTIKDHCIYEGDLKRIMKEKVKYKGIPKEELVDILNYNDLIEFIISKHGEYSNTDGGIEIDCKYIYNVTRQVVYTIQYLQSTVYERIEEYIRECMGYKNVGITSV
mgnify:CR=1 FL=1